jgi:uncharacterized membrane protein YhhN
MSTKHSFWLALFVALAAAELVGELSANITLIYWTKPFLMPVLAVWFYWETAGSLLFYRNAVMNALGFATAGDILLMLAHGSSGEVFFLLGLGAFLFCHIFYTGGFLMAVRGQNAFLRRHSGWTIPFIVYSAALLAWLWPGIPTGLHGPVSVYAIAISVMALSVMNLYKTVAKKAFYLLLAGALLFILSDSLIAIARFGHPFAADRVAIMSTYILGQLLLVSGARKLTVSKPDTGQADQK